MTRIIINLVLLLSAATAFAAEPPAPALLDPRVVQLRGAFGASLDRGIARLAQEPYTSKWLLADVSFEMERIFTNYSGDASGRFLELAALTSPRGQFSPATLKTVLENIAHYQKPDGHFGAVVDLTKPLARNSPPIPMLWGNARLLVGLVTCAREYNDPQLLAAAKRLGDFYVNTADQLCNPAREAEYHSSGTGGDGYACCHFPAIESLAMLYVATHDERYLKHAQRMADFFQKFDNLPVDHSHGNLCAWRGILLLYDITGQRAYLDLARRKWERAVTGGYVWALGGVGEHWYIFHPGDEGCSESDWLRFNLELHRFTGETRYLDVAERLLQNQYLANQCPNGGYGWRRFQGDAAGPIATYGSVDEWPFCCSFHGPLGLHWLKAYLASATDRGIRVNLLIDFDAQLKAAGRDWRLSVRTQPDYQIELAPVGQTTPAHATLQVRIPSWATVKSITLAGTPVNTRPADGYLSIDSDFALGRKLRIALEPTLSIESRRFQPVALKPGQIARLRDVAILSGPQVLMAAPLPGSTRPTLLATIDSSGHLDLPAHTPTGFATVCLDNLDATEQQAIAALTTARCVSLRTGPAAETRRRSAFMCDLLVLPAAAIEPHRAKLAERARQIETTLTGPFFGQNLEKQQDIWLAADGWRFTPQGILVSAGDIGLLDGEGYTDYRFEFDLTLPQEGQGITGWVVRAASPNDCIMFQIQSADSTYNRPEFRTRPNTLRPHVRRNGQWIIADPVPLPFEVRRGTACHVSVECRGNQIEVTLDGKKVYAGTSSGMLGGAVGFRAVDREEQGLFQRISLRKL